MKPASFSKYLGGNRRPGAVVLEKLSRMGINTNWLLTGTGSMLNGTVVSSPTRPPDPLESLEERQSESTTETNGSDSRVHKIPLVRIREDPDGTLRLIETGRSEWINDGHIREKYGVHPEGVRDFRVSGDSMIDTIRPGDKVRAALWDCRPPSDGTIYILRGPISLMVRRVRLHNDTILLVADNPEVPDQQMRPEDWEDAYEPIARLLEIRRTV